MWQGKLWRARLLRQIGPELTAKLYTDEPSTQPLIMPPGLDYCGPVLNGLDSLRAGAGWVSVLQELEAGSNNWVLSGQRSASGAPLLAGDPHRALDTPNVFYQNHLACPEFDAVGLSFPGVPGLPHFGHNRSVAWCVTTAMADYQDLYLERFHPGNPQLYETAGQWRPIQHQREVIRVRHGQPLEIDVSVTHHGPIIIGDPAQGYALALRYTALVEPNTSFDALLPMLRAPGADELEEALRPWVDPCNNILFADVNGQIGYERGARSPFVPRPTPGCRCPVGRLHMTGKGIPFTDMPHLRNPGAGYMVTANNRIVDESYPHYLALHYEPGFRARRIRDCLLPLTAASVWIWWRSRAIGCRFPLKPLWPCWGVWTGRYVLGSGLVIPAAMGRHHGTGQCRRDDLCRVPG